MALMHSRSCCQCSCAEGLYLFHGRLWWIWATQHCWALWTWDQLVDSNCTDTWEEEWCKCHNPPRQGEWVYITDAIYVKLIYHCITFPYRCTFVVVSTGTSTLLTAECYNPDTNEWTLIAPMSTLCTGLGVFAYKQHLCGEVHTNTVAIQIKYTLWNIELILTFSLLGGWLWWCKLPTQCRGQQPLD